MTEIDKLYTPRTAIIRGYYATAAAFGGDVVDSALQFNRWLHAHDAKIRAAALAEAERELAKAWYEGWCAGERWGYWVEREDPINHQDLSMSANPYGDYTPPENERESNWPPNA